MSGPATSHGHHPIPVFRISLGVIALIAFTELITAAVAIAMRVEESREVRIVERIVPRIIAVPTPVAARAADPGSGLVSAVPPTLVKPKPAPEPSRLPPPTPLNAPAIADPVVERLVNEAREARVAEDLRLALVKLEEAQQSAPDDPNVLYEMGLAFEIMGVYDRASEFYQAVFELGTSGAGALYEQAAIKLRDGFEQPEDKRGRLALGRVRVFRDKRQQARERVVLTVPIHAVPGEHIDPADLEIVVRFFDEVGDGEPQPASNASSTNYEWVTGQVDWQNGEELLRVTYTLPKQDIQQRHLFGERHYHGQVVELVYRSTLIDSQAWPRILARKVDAPERDPLFLDQDLVPPDFNPDAPLLPPPLPE